MPRRRSGGKSSGRSYSTGSSGPRFRSSPSLKKSSPKPAKAKYEPKKVETTYGGSNSGSFGSIIADGFLWGTGFAIAHIFVGAIAGPRTIRQEIVVPEKVNEVANVSAMDYFGTCDISYNAFQDCLKVPGNNISKCHLFMDSWIRCSTGKRNSSSS